MIKVPGYKYKVTKKCRINGEMKYNGSIIDSDIPIEHNNLEATYAFTVHSIQGETFEHTMFLADCSMNWSPGYIYTAITRPRRLDQIVVVRR